MEHLKMMKTKIVNLAREVVVKNQKALTHYLLVCYVENVAHPINIIDWGKTFRKTPSIIQMNFKDSVDRTSTFSILSRIEYIGTVFSKHCNLNRIDEISDAMLDIFGKELNWKCILIDTDESFHYDESLMIVCRFFTNDQYGKMHHFIEMIVQSAKLLFDIEKEFDTAIEKQRELDDANEYWMES
jgi:hypothetical protein